MRTSLPLKFNSIICAVALFFVFASLVSGCEIWRGGVSAETLTRVPEQPEEGWVYAEGGDVRAACPASWTLELITHRTRAWRCSHPDAAQGPFDCGLTVYGDRGADNLDEIVEALQPDIEAYGDESELLSSERTSLGGQPSQLFTLDQRFDEIDVRGWFHLVDRDEGGAWLAHCMVPQARADEDAEMVNAIFDRIEF